jgi:hypothetical protein
VDAIIKFLKLEIMKIDINKSIKLLTAFAVVVSLSSCLKEKAFTNETTFSGLQDHVLLVNGGVQNFGSNNIRFNSDTASYSVIANLASVNLPSSPVGVTIFVDAAAITAYNAANGTSFELMPSNAYTLGATSLTIPAGKQYATTTLQVYQAKIDPAKSYLLPISIKDASGKALSSNQNTMFFNIIGNVIAGNYKWDFTRWSNPTQTGSPDGTSFTGKPTAFIADNSTQVEVPSGYYIQPRYVISFTNTGGVLSNFTVSFNATDLGAMTTAGIVITDGPKFTKADPVNGEYIIHYTTATRYVIDRYYK